MAFIEIWRNQIPMSLQAFAGLITQPEGINLGFFATAILWPIRDYDGDDNEVITALQHVVGDDADRLLKLVRSWRDDRMAVMQDLAQQLTTDTSLRVALDRLAITMLTSSGMAVSDVPDTMAQTSLINFIVHIGEKVAGDKIYISDVANSVVTLNSTLSNVEQRVVATPTIDEETKALLQQVIDYILQLSPDAKRDSTQSIDTLIQGANTALRFNDFEEAKNISKNMLTRDPAHPEANLIAAVALLNGQGADSLPIRSASLGRVEAHLERATTHPSTARTAWAIWGIVRYDRYYVAKFSMGDLDIYAIRGKLNGNPHEALNYFLLSRVVASSNALKFFELAPKDNTTNT